MTKHDAMKAYFEPKISELVGDLLNFNFSPESEDAVSFITNYSDKVRKCTFPSAGADFLMTLLKIKNVTKIKSSAGAGFLVTFF